ncbi:MauM/NapG family ferredoxin-type protein [Malonomonas rubra DSM 5091]|uniref:MauM/NapG family ferredoxin-type protein n=1 Tax=Malonomonas rubra DSM 5091 TaxID=1122189 RepID=A0A1M6G9J7_MALRU|nr:4Fe-4S binding protein [Malonomonas rubra]SHJ06564.1 MauM/NapG family ferredoxin-type protein [Malonomonas rubra DSM 5091]
MNRGRRNLLLRRTVQLFCLGGFVWLFLQTEYRGLDELPYPVSLLFRLDPLAALADLLAPGPFSWSLWPALLLLVLTAFFGRFFCGWICPLGTTLDGCGKLTGRGSHLTNRNWRKLKYLLLFGMTAAALGGVQLLGLFDPLAIFLRSLTLSIYPAYNLLLNGLFDWGYQHDLPLLSSLYPLFRDNLMAFFQPSYTLGLFTLFVFLTILLLERVERRFWCKNLCPLGALLGLCSSHALLKRVPDGLCVDCSICASECRMDVVAKEGQRNGECIACLDCTDYCPQERARFVFKGGTRRQAHVDIGRRDLLLSVSAGAMIAPVGRIAPDSYKLNPYLLRPPGAVAEDEFLRRCVRCGECMKVCIGQALHPALLEAGATGLWTPLLVARLGYCEFNCTLCGQVCPTGAIKLLPVELKRKTIIGLAVFDRNRCLPFARGEECLVCEEHCPTPEKAIVFDEKSVDFGGEMRTLKVPRVVTELCIGCGICETKCPLDGVSAIRVINEIETRRPQSLQRESSPYG